MCSLCSASLEKSSSHSSSSQRTKLMDQSSQPAELPQNPPQTKQEPPTQSRQQRLDNLLIKAEKVLEAAYELYHGDRESVSHAYLINRMKELDGKMDRVLEAHAQLDKKVADLETRSEQFARRINEKVNRLAVSGEKK